MKLTFPKVVAKIHKVYKSIKSAQQLDVADNYCHRLKHRIAVSSDEVCPFHKADLKELIAREIYVQKELTIHRITKEGGNYECEGCTKKYQVDRT